MAAFGAAVLVVTSATITAAASMVAAPTHLISHGLYTIVALPFPRLT